MVTNLLLARRAYMIIETTDDNESVLARRAYMLIETTDDNESVLARRAS